MLPEGGVIEIEEGDRGHRFDDDDRSSADTRIVATGNGQPYIVSFFVNRPLLDADRAGRLDRGLENDLLTAGDSAQDASAVVAQKPVFGPLIIGMAASHRGQGEPVAELNPFYRSD